MQYFNQFNTLLYKFGNETNTVLFQDLTSYVEVIDQIKDNISAYQYEYILDGWRPDHMSLKFYGTPIYHWTFFILNDKLKFQGWPLTNKELTSVIDKEFPNTVITTRDVMTGLFKVGQTITGSVSGTSGKIIHRNANFGTLTIEGSKTFNSDEAINATVDGVDQVVTLVGTSAEKDAVHHYENASKEWVDITPSAEVGAGITPVTNSEYYIAQNDNLRTIKIINPNLIDQVVTAYKQGIAS